MTRHRGKILAGMVCFMAAVATSHANAANEDALAARVKAAFVFNFIRFTEWPAEAFTSPKDPLVVGVVGTGEIPTALEDTLRGKLVNDRPIVVQRFAADAIGRCHVLYVALPGGSAGDVLRKLPAGSLLTVGDSDGFTNVGGVARLFEEDGKERFEINVDAAARARLQISAKLLKLAKTINK